MNITLGNKHKKVLSILSSKDLKEIKHVGNIITLLK